MKSITYSFSGVILVFLMVFATSCDCIVGEGDLVTEIREVADFSGISLNTNARVVLKQDSVYSLIIKAQPNILDVLETEVQGDLLKISTKSTCISGGKGITINLSLPELEEVNVNGSGQVISPALFIMEELDLSMNGSGGVIMEVHAQDISSSINGSGVIEMRGKAVRQDAIIRGSGEIYTPDLEVRKANVEIYGSGNCKLFPTEYLDVYIGGSGNVYYKGNPDISTKIRGSGEILQMNIQNFK